ncbi:DUF6924 domain-containing protein [Streptomyces uncialis]
MREFRTTPAATHDMHANLAVGNLVFEEYAREALSDPEGVLRPL